MTQPPLCPDQLALDIDRDTEDQNRYLDGMVRVCDVPCAAPCAGPTWAMEASPTSDPAGLLPSGVRLHQCDRPAHRECEALFHHGTVWARQPKAAVWYGCGTDRGLLHPLLPPVEGKDVSQWELASVGAWGNQRLPHPGVLGSRGPAYEILL